MAFEVYPGLIASELFWFDEAEEKYSFRVWLWENQVDLKRWAERWAAGKKEPGRYDDALGLFSPNMWLEFDEPGQHLGEIHFVAGKWDLEHVAHECLHALMHFLRFQKESLPRVIYRMYTNWMDWEEEICYPFGQLVDGVYRWLWKKNPNPKWSKDRR